MCCLNGKTTGMAVSIKLCNYLLPNLFEDLPCISFHTDLYVSDIMVYLAIMREIKKISAIQEIQNFEPPENVIVIRPITNHNKCNSCQNETMITTILRKQFSKPP